MSRRPLSLSHALAVSLVVSTVAGLAGPSVAGAADKPKPAWRTEKHILEVGGYLGAFFPAKDHGLYGDGVVTTQRELKTGFDIGLRLAYLPLRFIGIEIEGGAVPTKALWTNAEGEDRKASATVFGVRGHFILQMPTQLALFVVGGGGILGVGSKNDVLGKNVDGSLHIGGGLKYYATPRVVLRIDGRDVVSPSWSKGTVGGTDWAHHGEFTFGAAFVLGRKTAKMLKKG